MNYIDVTIVLIVKKTTLTVGTEKLLSCNDQAFDVWGKRVYFLNPGQTPIITADQQLFVLVKQIQLGWQDLHNYLHNNSN